MADDDRHLKLPQGFKFHEDGEEPLPADITSIEFDCYFDSPIPDGALPKGLKHINFGWYFNKEVHDGNIPESVESMTFGCWFQQPISNLSVRNLKKIVVHVRYCEMVSPSLVPLMPEYYQKNLEGYKKLSPEFYNQCADLDNSLLPPLNPFDEDSDNESEIDRNATEIVYDDENAWKRRYCINGFEIDCLPSIMNSIHRFAILSVVKQLTKAFTTGNHTLDSIAFEVNKKNQLVVTVEQSWWDWTKTVFIGRDGVFYRVYQASGYVPKPRPPTVNGSRIGPITIEQMAGLTF